LTALEFEFSNDHRQDLARPRRLVIVSFDSTDWTAVVFFALSSLHYSIYDPAFFHGRWKLFDISARDVFAIVTIAVYLGDMRWPSFPWKNAFASACLGDFVSSVCPLKYSAHRLTYDRGSKKPANRGSKFCATTKTSTAPPTSPPTGAVSAILIGVQLIKVSEESAPRTSMMIEYCKIAYRAEALGRFALRNELLPAPMVDCSAARVAAHRRSNAFELGRRAVLEFDESPRLRAMSAPVPNRRIIVCDFACRAFWIAGSAAE